MAAAVPDDPQLLATQVHQAKRPEDEYVALLDRLDKMGSVSNGNAAGPATNGIASLTANRGQMDINMLYQKLLELSDVLQDNREKTQGIVASAEEYAVGPDLPRLSPFADRYLDSDYQRSIESRAE